MHGDLAEPDLQKPTGEKRYLSGVHFLNEQHLIYQGINAIARIRAQEPALRYGRLYFRELSEDGNTFGYPTTGHCTLAYSRILDTDEVLVALNLDPIERKDCITVDGNLTPPGSEMIDLLNGVAPLSVEETSFGRAFVRVPLQGLQIAILKRGQ